MMNGIGSHLSCFFSFPTHVFNPNKQKTIYSKNHLTGAPPWRNAIGGVSGTMGHRFYPRPSTGLGIQCYRSYALGHNCPLDLIPFPGTPFAAGRPKKQKLKTKNKVRGPKSPNFRTYCKAAAAKTMWFWHQDRCI